jgi:hypothetical protein
MVDVHTSGVVYRGFEPQSDQTKDKFFMKNIFHNKNLLYTIQIVWKSFFIFHFRHNNYTISLCYQQFKKLNNCWSMFMLLTIWNNLLLFRTSKFLNKVYFKVFLCFILVFKVFWHLRWVLSIWKPHQWGNGWCAHLGNSTQRSVRKIQTTC